MIDIFHPDFTNTPVDTRRPGFTYVPDSAAVRPAVSIITPYYNTGELFLETAKSVLGQSFQQWEWLIINDGSTDANAIAVLDAWRTRDSRIRVIDHAQNRGLSAARNTGASAASAEFVVYLDSDDLIEPTFVEKCLWHLYTNPEVAFTKGYSVGFGAENYIWTNGFHEGDKFLTENRVDPTSMIRRSVFLASGGNDETIRGGMEDWDFWLRAASKGYWGDTILEPLNWYRRREGHWNRWQNIAHTEKRDCLVRGFRERYGKLWESFPRIPARWHMPYEPICLNYSFTNTLAKPRRRALFLVPHLEMGGGDQVNLDLMRLLTQDHGWEITVVSTRKSDDMWAGLFYAITPDVFMLHRFLRTPDYPRFIKYIIESRGIDVLLLCHSQLGYRLLPFIKAAFPSLPVVDLLHLEQEEWKSGGYPRLSINNRAYLSRSIVVSRHLKDWMVAHGHPGASIDICYANVDTAYWSRSEVDLARARAKWGVKLDVPILLYPCRFTEQKFPQALPAIVRELRQRGIPFQLILAGDGPLRDWLVKNLVEPNSECVSLVGPVPRANMRELMACVDLLLLPSKMEGIALVLFEAMSMGVVPVATNVGGQAELVTPECGTLVDLGPAMFSKIAEAVGRILCDEELRAAMSKACAARVRTSYKLSQLGANVDRIFRDCLSSDIEQTPPGGEGVLEACASEAIETSRIEELAEELWAQKTSAGPDGRALPKVVSKIARAAKSLPVFGPVASAIERRYGVRIGHIVLRIAS